VSRRQQEITAVGAADNVDLSERDPTTPLEKNVDDYRIVVAHCCTCGEHDTIHAEPGRSHKWHHDQRNPTHVVEYHREDDGGRR
jgi:hypothetical protein